MKEVQIVAWCDKCYADADVRAQADTHTVKIDGFGPREIELCDLHAKELLEPLRQFIAEHGTVPKAAQPAAAAQGEPCPLCGVTLSRYSIATHVYRVHGGLDADTPQPGQEGPCPECGEEFEYLAQHRSRAHGVTAAKFAVEWVRRNGMVK